MSTPPDLNLEVHGAKKRARTLQGRPDPYSTGHYSDLDEPGEQKTFSKDEPSSLASLFPGEGPGLQRSSAARRIEASRLEIQGCLSVDRRSRLLRPEFLRSRAVKNVDGGMICNLRRWRSWPA